MQDKIGYDECDEEDYSDCLLALFTSTPLKRLYFLLAVPRTLEALLDGMRHKWFRFRH